MESGVFAAMSRTAATKVAISDSVLNQPTLAHAGQ